MARIFKHIGKNGMIAAHKVAEAIKNDYINVISKEKVINEDVWYALFMYIWNIVRYGEYLTECKIIIVRIKGKYRISNIKSKVRKSSAKNFIKEIDIANQYINNPEKILELRSERIKENSKGMMTMCYSVIVGKFEMYEIAYYLEKKITYISKPIDDEYVEMSMVVELPVSNIEKLIILKSL